MSSSPTERPDYVVPRYRAPDDAIWYHVLHGTVPGHQMDFMYRPEVPHGAFTQTHFGHLARLMKYIEPREHAPYAFALGNLSRDDVQHEPGHGGIALLFGLRVEGVLDHAGRAMPPCAHAIVAVNRAFDVETLRDAALVLHQRLLSGEPSYHRDTSERFYRRYARAVRRSNGAVERLLRRYIDDFTALPRPEPSRLAWSFVADDPALPERVTIVHPDGESFPRLAHTAARLAAMLYRSNLKWTAISTGREPEIPGGVSVRFVPASEATTEPAGLVVSLEDIPDDEVAMAQALFGARPRVATALPARVGWRERDAAQKAAEATLPDIQSGDSRGVPARSAPALADPHEIECDLGEDQPVKRFHLWMALGALVVGACTSAAILGATLGAGPSAPTSAAAPTVSPPPIAPVASEPPRGAWDSTSPRRLDVARPGSVNPWRSNRRAKDEIAPAPGKTASPRAPSSTAPGAIGGKPRF